MLLAADPALSARDVALGQDYAYLQKQAANIRQLKNEALSSGDEIDSFVEELELRQYLDDAAVFVAQARADGSPELLEMAANVQNLLLSLGVNAEELDRAIRHSEAGWRETQKSPATIRQGGRIEPNGST